MGRCHARLRLKGPMLVALRCSPGLSRQTRRRVLRARDLACALDWLTRSPCGSDENLGFGSEDLCAITETLLNDLNRLRAAFDPEGV